MRRERIALALSVLLITGSDIKANNLDIEQKNIAPANSLYLYREFLINPENIETRQAAFYKKLFEKLVITPENEQAYRWLMVSLPDTNPAEQAQALEFSDPLEEFTSRHPLDESIEQKLEDLPEGNIIYFPQSISGIGINSISATAASLGNGKYFFHDLARNGQDPVISASELLDLLYGADRDYLPYDGDASTKALEYLIVDTASYIESWNSRYLALGEKVMPKEVYFTDSDTVVLYGAFKSWGGIAYNGVDELIENHDEFIQNVVKIFDEISEKLAISSPKLHIEFIIGHESTTHEGEMAYNHSVPHSVELLNQILKKRGVEFTFNLHIQPPNGWDAVRLNQEIDRLLSGELEFLPTEWLAEYSQIMGLSIDPENYLERSWNGDVPSNRTMPINDVLSINANIINHHFQIQTIAGASGWDDFDIPSVSIVNFGTNTSDDLYDGYGLILPNNIIILNDSIGTPNEKGNSSIAYKAAYGRPVVPMFFTQPHLGDWEKDSGFGNTEAEVWRNIRWVLNNFPTSNMVAFQ